MSTKFLRKSTRRLIRDYDQFQQVYPSPIRSSDPLNNGIDTQARFDDTSTLAFTALNASFPSMLPVGESSLPSSSINAIVSLKSRAIEQRPNLPGRVEDLTPFNESIFNLPATYENTASIAFAPGFSVPARNKIAIPIDITANQEKFMFRLGSQDTSSDLNGLFYGQSSTGFCYYNFSLKRWEDIGLDPLYTGHMGAVTPSTEYNFSGQNYFMAQFVGTPNITSPTSTKDDDVYTGYDKIGSPTEFFDAPYAPRYHASASQGLLLSNYIAQPFVLERIDVTLPFVARRKHGPIKTGAYAESALRDVDNLVFFLYRQSGKDDQLQSVRSLISHESLSFYNQKVNTKVDYEQHNPIFAHDYNITLSSTTEKLFTGSISFTMYPKLTSKNFAGTTGYSIKDTFTIPPTYRRAGILNFWSGPQESVLSSSINSVDGILLPTGNNDFWRIENTTMSGGSYLDNLFRSNLNPDPRFLTNYATGSLYPTQNPFGTFGDPRYSSTNWSQYNTPYVLLPEDRLIIGLETDICARSPIDRSYDSGYDSSYLSVTSSFFKILTDQAQVTLYGSLVQDGVAKRSNSINQNLTSPAAHEIITNVQDDTDQFDIAERSLFVGTYLDNFITGSMLLNTRGVAQSIVEGPQISSGSFIRCLPLSDADKTYFQKGQSVLFGIFVVPYSEQRNPKNYFRPNRYGNIRDMLEQARDYRIFNKTLYKKSGGFEDQGPAYAKFVLSSSETPVSADLTQCNNLSPYMTGTFPFVDGISTSTSRGAYTTTQNNPFIPITNIFKS